MKVLVVAAHPDDEVLGCGATIAKHAKKGDEVEILILGDGITARYEEHELNNPEVLKQVSEINKHALNAGKMLGAKKVELKGFHCGRFDRYPLIDITKIIEKKLNDFKPERVYTHGPVDANNDHKIVFKAVQIATRPIRRNYFVKDVFIMENLSGLEWGFDGSFRPDYYNDVEKTIGLKIKAMQEYSGEKRKFPHPRSDKAIIALSIKRGSESGLDNAEAFKVLRMIN